MKVALDDPRTRAALFAYQRGALQMFSGGATGVVIGVVVMLRTHGDPTGLAGVVANGGIPIGGVALLTGSIGLWRSWRAKRLLGRQPWLRRHAAYRIARGGRNGQPALVVHADAHGDEAVCSIPATVWRYRRMPQGAHIAILVAGNPRRWSVVAPPDAAVLLIAKRPWVPLWRWQLRRLAMRDR